MANLSISANLRFWLNGTAINAPVEWQDIQILANFDNDSIQANITTDSFSFVNEARTAILAYIEQGKTGGLGIFEGLPFKIEAVSSTSTVTVFDGFLDLTNDFKDYPDRGRCECRVIKADGLNSLEERLEAITYGFLYSKGLITRADYVDVTYVVVKPDQAKDIAMTSIVIYALIKEVQEQIREFARDPATTSGIAAAGVSGPAGALIFAIAAVLFQLAYTALILVAIANMASTIINALYPIRRKGKAMKLRTLLEKACAYAGYSFESSINELNYYNYMPTNPSFDSAGFLSVITQGVLLQGYPNSSDYGYRCVEMLDLCKKLFKAKYAIVNNTVQFHWEGSSYWLKTANYNLPSVLIESYRYNTEEFKANTVLAFDTDLSDEWTLNNFTGTNYQVIANSINSNSPKAKFIKGLNEVRFPVALGNRKDRSTVLESVLESLNGYISAIKKIFGGNAPLSGTASVNGILKVSNNNFVKPKLIYLIDSSMPANHRDLLSAKYLYENFHHYDSFVSSNFAGQKIVYEGARVPFGLNNFIELIQNSYFSNGAKAIKVDWRLGSDYAVIDYWKREVYTKNLNETFIEP